VVTADGKLLRASADQNADLFWAIRGGGGNFGIVTSFEFQLHAVGPELLSGLIVFPLDQARSVLRQYRDFADTIPDELSVWAVSRLAPPLPFLPTEVHGKPVVVLAICHTGDVREGEKLIEPLRTFGTPYGEHVGPMPFTAWQQAFDPLLAPGARNYWKSHNFAELSDGAIDIIVEAVGKLPSPHCEVFLGLVGGQMNRVAPDATAYSYRSDKFVMNVHGRWDTPEEDERCIAWARELFEKSTPYATGGVYVNFMAEDETDRVGAAYGPNYDRLVDVKTKYDPQNLFRLNHNIAPKS
jgi:FAD/FMN-containing dehydrogenase